MKCFYCQHSTVFMDSAKQFLQYIIQGELGSFRVYMYAHHIPGKDPISGFYCSLFSLPLPPLALGSGFLKHQVLLLATFATDDFSGVLPSL